MKNINLFSISLVCTVLALFFFGNVFAQEPVNNESEPYVDSSIYNFFNNSNQVYVSIKLRANLSSIYSSSIQNPEERAKWIKDIKHQVDEVQDKVIPTLSEEEFKIKYRYELSPTFSGNITKEGLEKLRNSPYVERINLVEKVYASENLDNLILDNSLECDLDIDCVVVSPSCCGCYAASDDVPINEVLTSINKSFLDQWNLFVEERCKDSICSSGVNENQMLRCNSYGSRCINNKCFIVKIGSEIKGNLPKNNLNLLYGVLLLITLIWIIFYLLKRRKKLK